MGFKSVVKKSLVRGFNVKRWVGVETIKRDTQVVKAVFRSVFQPNGTVEQDAQGRPVQKKFADYVREYGLTEETLTRRMKQLRWMAYFCWTLGLVTVVYAFVLWTQYAQWMNGFVCVMLALVLWAQGLREHFNAYQISQKRLGCAISEWLNSLVGR